ncbi:hypothetical protein BSP239C_03279 [Brevibacterium sp. 239c]|nr:hypothetical protein BSP239C_03279 [Brevibacterium sp. 239c]
MLFTETSRLARTDFSMLTINEFDEYREGDIITVKGDLHNGSFGYR